MPGVLADALEREHREIDSGVEEFTKSYAQGTVDTAPLQRAIDGLRRHIYLEEEFIFPTLRSGGLMAPVLVMLREHGQLWKTCASIEDELAGDPGSPRVQGLCDDLTSQLDAHNGKEEPVIYPQVDAALDAGATAKLTDFLADGMLPDGWVCERAR